MDPYTLLLEVCNLSSHQYNLRISYMHWTQAACISFKKIKGMSTFDFITS